MSFLRSGAITIFSIVLLLSIFLMNISLTLSWSLEHDNIKPALKDSIKDLLKDNINIENSVNNLDNSMKNYCRTNAEYVFSQENYTFTIPCEVIQEGTESVIDYAIEHLIDTVYYAEYNNCKFWSCVKETSAPLVLVSEKAHDYWKTKFYLFMAISIVLFALIFFVSKNKTVAFFVAGILMVLASLPFRKFDWLFSLAPKEISGIIPIFFTKSYSVFLIMLIIGLIILGIGLVFRFFGLGMKISRWFSKEGSKDSVSKSQVKEIVREELSKKSPSKSKRKKKHL